MDLRSIRTVTSSTGTSPYSKRALTVMRRSSSRRPPRSKEPSATAPTKNARATIRKKHKRFLNLCEPLCSLCLCGYRNVRYHNHRGTENTEVHREVTQTRKLPLKPVLCIFHFFVAVLS